MSNFICKINIRIFILLFAVFFAIGTVFLVLFITDNVNKKHAYIEKAAVVEQIVNEWDSANEKVIYHVYVRYEMYGNGYIVELKNYSGDMTEGEKVTILVNQFKPDEITTLTANQPNILYIVLFSTMYSLSVASFVLLMIKLRMIRNGIQDRYINQMNNK